MGTNQRKILDAKKSRKEANMKKPGFKSKYAMKVAARRG